MSNSILVSARVVPSTIRITSASMGSTGCHSRFVAVVGRWLVWSGGVSNLARLLVWCGVGGLEFAFEFYVMMDVE